MCHQNCNTDQKNPNPRRAFHRVTFIYGQVAQQMSKADLFQVIAHVEKQLADLRAIEISSTAVTDEIATLEKQLAQIVAYTDKRTY